MAPKKPAKPTKLQVKAGKKDKVLTGPKGSKPQSTTTNRVRTQGGTTMSKPAPSAGRRVNPKAAKPKPAAAKPARPALPPGRQGGPLATRPPTQSTRQANARAQLRDASRGSTGPNRVGQPAGSANRMYGANVVNRSVNRAVTQTNLRGALAKGAAPTAIAGALLNAQAEFEKLKALLKNPKGALSRASSDILSGKPYDPKTVTKSSKPATPKPQRQGPAVPTRLANAPAPAKLPKPTPKPKPPSATTPTRSSASSRPTTSSRPASRPAATPAKAKPPAASKPTVAQTSGIGPVKSGDEYARTKGSLREQARRLREMQAESRKRQGK